MNKFRRFVPLIGLLPVVCYAFGRTFPQQFWGTILPCVFALAGIILIISAIRHRNTAEVNSYLRSALGMLLLAFGFIIHAGWHPEMGTPLSLEATYCIYLGYMLINFALFVFAVIFRRKSNKTPNERDLKL